jgi:hypothetical protein
MKTINFSLHTGSAIAGALLLLTATFAIGAIAPQNPPMARDISAVEIMGQPRPQDYMRVQQGNPFTVPAGQTFVARGLGFAGNPGANAFSITILFDGVEVLSEYGWHVNNIYGMFHDQKLCTIPLGIAAPEGTVVSITSSRTDGVAIGFLSQN